MLGYHLYGPLEQLERESRSFLINTMKIRKVVVLLLLLACAASVGAQTSSNWTEFTDEELGMRVSFPAAIARSSEVVDTDEGKGLSITYTSAAGGAEFSVAVTDMPIGKKVPAKVLFDGGRDGMLGFASDAKATVDRDLTVGGRAARDITVTSKEVQFRTRLFYVDGRMYQVLVTVSSAMAKDAKLMADAAKFIDSVTFIPAKKN